MSTAAARNDEIYDLYRELILDHARKPRHFGRLDNASHTAQGINPLCGDKLALYLVIDKDQCIRAATFEGSGCAISVASASLLSDTVTGMTVDEAETVYKTVKDRLTIEHTTDDESVDLEEPLSKLRALEGVREFPSRVKCATLAWQALHSALNQQSTPATTE